MFCSFPLQLRLYKPNVSFKKGQLLKDSANPQFLFNLLFPSDHNQLRIFTDGSKDDQSPFTGFAVLEQSSNYLQQFRASNKASIFTCKAMAILSSLQEFCECSFDSIHIFSDSKSGLQVLSPHKNFRSRSPLIWEILHLLWKLERRGKRVMLYWIPAHVGIEGNERVDLAAREALRNGRDTELFLPYSDFRSLWSEKLYTSLYAWAGEEGQGHPLFLHFFPPWQEALVLSLGFEL